MRFTVHAYSLDETVQHGNTSFP